MEKRIKILTATELYERNLIKAINTRVCPVASYVMNVCDFNQKQLEEFDMLIQRALREKGMHGRQASDERLYMKNCDGGRGLKSMKDVYEDTKVRIACYMAYKNSPWIEVAWESETSKEGKSLCRYVNDTLEKYGSRITVNRDGMYDGGKLIIGTWKDVWKKMKGIIKDSRRTERKEAYAEKRMQSEIYKGLDEGSHQWLRCNMNPGKVSAIINMQEQMVETRAWKCNRGIAVDTDKCLGRS